MSTQTAQLIEFRCKSCWHTAQAELEMEGRKISCPNCGKDNVVPEATPDRLCDARPIDSAGANPYAPLASSRVEPSDAELMKMVERENRSLPGGSLNYNGYPSASIVARFFANLLDSLYMVTAFGLGLLAVFAAAAVGLVEMPEQGQSRFDPTILIIFSFIPIVATIIQWNLIATRGQTLGKLVVCIRMITMDGRLPGFLHGVVLRNWVRALLGAFVPLFGLIDVLFIFSDSKRCIHDYLAGTRVVQA